MNRLAKSKRSEVIAALVEGVSINAPCRVTGVAKHTVLKLLKDLGCAAASYHNQNVRNLRVRRVQADEIWSFVGAKMKNASEEKVVNHGWGDIWTWTAIDADTKLIVSYMLGQRGADTANAFMQDVASRIKTRIQLTTDGHRVYADAVENAFGGDIDYAMLVKIYGASLETESRSSPATRTGCRTGTLAGIPDPKHVSTSFVERQNLSMRMGMRRFTRLTNAFSKKLENHGHAVALYFMHYDFCRVHKTLRVTPAMEAGLADHVWDLEELLALMGRE